MFQRKSINRDGNSSSLTAPGRLESGNGTKSTTISHSLSNESVIKSNNAIPCIMMPPKPMAILDNFNDSSMLKVKIYKKNKNI